MQKIKDFFFSLYFTGFLFLGIAVAIGAATFIETVYGNVAARILVYNARWFEGILLLFVINLLGNLFRFPLCKKRKLSLGLFHLAFIFIILGAGVTRYFGFEGIMHLREQEASSSMQSSENYFSVDWLQGNHQDSWSRKVTFSLFNKDEIHQSFKINKNELTIRSVDYAPSVGKRWMAAADGKPYLRILKGGSSGNQYYEFPFGNELDFPGIRMSWTDQSAELFFGEENGRIFMSSRIPLSETAMGNKGSRFVEAGEVIEVHHGKIYRLENHTFVITELLPQAKERVSPDSRGSSLSEGVLCQIEYQGERHNIWIASSRGELPLKNWITIKDVKVALSYGPKIIRLPFSLKLNDFILDRYPGSQSPSSYESRVMLIDPELEGNEEHRIYMNNVLSHRGYRFYQSGYDPDEKGTVLSVNQDRWGTLLTYLGYFLMILAMFWSLFNRNSYFYKKMTAISTGSLPGVLFLLLNNLPANARTGEWVLPAEEVAGFEKLWVQGNDGRVEPFLTLSDELLRKIYGKTVFDGQSSTEVVMGMMTWPETWQKIPLIKVKNKAFPREFGLTDSYLAYSDFFDKNSGNYILTERIQKIFAKPPAIRSRFDNDLLKIDERLNVAYLTFRGKFFRFFPSPRMESDQWIAPDGIINNWPEEDSLFVTNSLQLYFGALYNADYERAQRVREGITRFQQKFGFNIIPSGTKRDIEIIYNHLTIFKKIFPVYLLMGLLICLGFIVNLLRGKKIARWMEKGFLVIIILSFTGHTLGLIARGYISGHVPWSDGYESMIYVAWVGVLAGLIFARKNYLVLGLATLLSGLTLMVAHLSWMNPEVTNLVPVLKSYWLTFHVAIITASYGFVGMCAFIGLFVLILMGIKNEKNRKLIDQSIRQLTAVNEAAMIIGLYFLTIGTILGAVWANESWGRYWGWDPKETWSLVSILIYSFVVHMRLMPSFRSYFAFNTASLLAIGSILMTFFGVNYFLTGLHSYAGAEPVSVPGSIYWGAGFVFLLIGWANWKESRFPAAQKVVLKM